MTQDKATSLTEHLFRYVVKNGKAQSEVEGDRQRDGTYVTGWRKTTVLSMLEHGDYVVKAARVESQEFSPAQDKTSHSYLLQVEKGRELVFDAERKGSSETKKFGAEERYLGTDTEPEGEWEVGAGAIPPELLQLSVS